MGKTIEKIMFGRIQKVFMLEETENYASFKSVDDLLLLV